MVFNKKIPLYDLGNIDRRSLVGFYFSQALLYLGIALVLLNSIDLLLPESDFGDINWLTMTVFSIGLVINFFSIPWLYFSSFKDFKKENDFWDKEIFWILPMFSFGTFFLYGTHTKMAYILFLISIVMIAVVHSIFAYMSWNFAKKKSKEAFANCHEYVVSIEYLTAYYFLLIALLIFCNPIQYIFGLIGN